MAALKFLSSAEIALNLGILTRPVFLAIWATLAIIAALYLLGWLVLSHDREPVKIGWFRRGFAIATLVMGGAFLGAINGLGLGDLNAFMPPDPYPSSSLAAESVDGLTWQQDLSKAAEQAQKEGKLLFVDFTGVFCTNCRAMEKNMFPIPAVQAEMSKFVTVKLYCDRPGNKQDDINAKLKEELTKSTELPSYVIMKADGKTALRITGFTKDRDGFLKFLKDE
ncbi:MAG: thioredoxin family protein [Armatimonadetes bacterium]|nr:thioredoxin family protein [Armatimonadota bacterium]